jgi:hypothetical protein
MGFSLAEDLNGGEKLHVFPPNRRFRAPKPALSQVLSQ